MLKREEVQLNGKTLEKVDGVAHNVNRRAVARNNDYLWPNGIVPYVLDSSLSKLIKVMYAFNVNNIFTDSAAVRAIRSAMSEYEAKTCIRFVQRTSESTYVRFIKDRG